jgi:hypothetical protein
VEGLGRGAERLIARIVKTRPILSLGIIVLATVLTGVFLPAISTPSNCGGNSAALSVCRMCALTVRMGFDGGQGTFDIHNPPEANKSELINICSNHWIPDANFLIKTNVSLDAEHKTVIIVCDHRYSNVPQPTFWNDYRKNPAHAVGYSDGSTGLITPKQFSELNLAEFIQITRLQTNNASGTNQGNRL